MRNSDIILLVDPSPSDTVCAGIASTGATVRMVAGRGAAMQALDEKEANVIVLGPSLDTDEARLLAEEAPGDVRLIRISEADAGAARLGEREADALLYLPIDEAAIAEVIDPPLPSPPRLPDAPLLIEASALGGGLDDAMRSVCRDLREAFRADVCAISSTVPGGLWVYGSQMALALTENEVADLRMRALGAARGRTITIARSLLTESGTSTHETCLGARIIGEDNVRVGLLALVHHGVREFTLPERELLEAIGRRLAVELSWRGVHAHVLAELDAMRGAGGLDPLLGIWSESTLLRLLEMMVSSAKRSGAPLTVAVIDVRGLAAINERHGHTAGDAVLRHVAELAVYAVRASDVVARYRGSIAVVFNDTSTQNARTVVERVRNMFDAEPFNVDGRVSINVDTRAGLAGLREDDDAEAMLARADAGARAAREMDTGIVTISVVPSGAPVGPPDSEGLRGLTLGGMYRVLHQIGSGGGGGVYRGDDLGLSRAVAIKVLNPELARDQKSLDRFRDEAAILGSLRHHSLVQIYAFGVDGGYAYFVMEMVEGESVQASISRHRKERSRPPLSLVSSITKQIASALDTLHRHGVVHRDVKPANVLIDPFRNRAVLVDVGIARRHDRDAYVAGTPPYMAPEMVSDPEVGPEADVFGLASTIYEMLVLERPWPDVDNLVKMVKMKRSRPPTPLSQHRPELEILDEVFDRGLHPDPQQRYPTVLDFALEARSKFARLQQETTGPDSGSLQSSSRLGGPMTLRGWQASRDAREPNTRVVVFRSLARVVGARKMAAWRVKLARRNPRAADAISPSKPPLGWLPTSVLDEILNADPPGTRNAEQLGRELGRATVRATFRRFFPASPATLSPRTTMAALNQIWVHYQSWGGLEIIVKGNNAASINISGTPRSVPICGWVSGLLEQLILLSGGSDPVIDKLMCEARGGNVCRFEVSWSYDPT